MQLSLLLDEPRAALRRIVRAPAIALTAALALGIGATTASFSAVYAVVLRPLPFREPDRLARLRAGVSGAQAQAELTALSRRVATGPGAGERGARVLGLEEDLVGGYRARLFLLLAAVVPARAAARVSPREVLGA